jgi:hypothetical protein
MIGKIARGAYLCIIAGMVAAYAALSLANSEAPKPQVDPPTWIIFA